MKKLLINGQIEAARVRVIGERGEELGILLLRDALALAQAQGLDLIETEPTSLPPTCLITDYGKFRYGMAKGRKGRTR